MSMKGSSQVDEILISWLNEGSLSHNFSHGKESFRTRNLNSIRFNEIGNGFILPRS